MTTIDAPVDQPALTEESARYYAPTLFARSATNPRKTFIPSKITELAESIKKMGQIQPILARPNPDYADGNGQPPYEIVCGECRWRAVIQGGMAGILAIIRQLTDFEVLELQIAENMARNDLNPLEEAEHMRRLLRQPDGLQGYASAEELGERLSKSRRWVFNRLALLNLCDEARTALLEGEINASVAGLIARMPDKAQQVQATARILQGFAGEPFSFRAAQAYLEKEFMLSLAKAKFDVLMQYDVAGPCGQCPKRSGANPDLFADVTSGDMCQDSECFKAKTSEARDLALASAQASGHTILRGEAARKLMLSPTYLPPGYHWFDQTCPALTDSKKTLRDIFGAKARDVITLDHPQQDDLISIAPTASVKKVLKAKNLLREEPPAPQLGSGATEATEVAASTQASAAQPQQPVKQKPRTERELEEARAWRRDSLYGTAVACLVRDELRTLPELPIAIAALLVMRVTEDLSYEAHKLLYELLEWDFDPEWPHHDSTLRAHFEGRIETLAKASAAGQLGEILILAQLVEELTDHWALEDLQGSEYHMLPSWSMLEALGLTDKLQGLFESAQAQSAADVDEEERERLGAAAPQSAGDAFAAAHGRQPVKYRCPMTGMTWSGRGLQPKWLKVAIADGKRLEDFQVPA